MAPVELPNVPQTPRRRLTIGRRLFYSHLLVALLVAFGLGSYLHWAAEAELRNALNRRVVDNANLAAEAVAFGDWDAIRTPNDTQRPEYAALVQRLIDIDEHNDAIDRLLLLREVDGQVTAVADSRGAINGYSPGDALPPALQLHLSASAEAQPIPATHDGLNAIAPIHRSAGRYLLALRVPTEDIAEKLATLRTNSAVSFVLAVVLALAMSMWLAQSARFVLRRFALRFRDIAEGRLGEKLNLGADDEFGDLAVVIEEMSVRLEQSQRGRDDALNDLKAARDRLEGMVRERSEELDKLNVMLRSEIEQRCQLEAALAEAAATDTMTRLLNRRGMLEAAEHAAEQARRQKGSFIVAIIDIDHFKRINDQYGHATGDQVLIALGRRIKDALHHHDAAGRWGGEEFLLLWAGLTITEGEKRANEFCQKIGTAPLYPSGPQITISIGVAEFTGLDTLDRCINRADKALYRAKMDGRNRVCVGV